MIKLVALAASLLCVLGFPVDAQTVEVVNAASFQRWIPVAPGSYVHVVGVLTQSVTDGAAEPPVPAALNNVQVLFDGIPGPIYALVNDQYDPADLVACVVPQGVQPGRRPVRVMLGGEVIGEGIVDVVPAMPGIFWVPRHETQTGGVRRGEDNAYVEPATPATRGGVIVIALTGQGTEVNNPVPDGFAPDGGESTTKKLPRVFVAGVEAEVQFSGLMPVFPGLWQINAVVPDKPFIKGLVPLLVTYEGLAANQVAMWVAP